MYYVRIPLGLLSWFSKYLRFYHFEYGIPSLFTQFVPARENSRKFLNVLLLMYHSVGETLVNKRC